MASMKWFVCQGLGLLSLRLGSLPRCCSLNFLGKEMSFVSL